MKKHRVMIVEDEDFHVTDIRSHLEKIGEYEVCGETGTGEDAVRLAGEDRPDIVLMDIVLKGRMDGIEAAGIIRERLNIPVIYLTYYSDEEKLQRAKITEPFGYILKPFNERELHASIAMALYKHAMEQERERLRRELKDALDHVKTLRGLIPICASCKKIRDDKGYWNCLEVYLEKHTEADFTHSVCPECTRKFFKQP